MKRISLFILTTLILTLSVCVNAENMDEFCTEIELTADNLAPGCGLAADSITWNDVGFTVTDVTQISFSIPEPIEMGKTAVIHIMGTCDDNFRLWFMTGEAATASNQVNMSSFAFFGGEFDEIFEFTMTDFDTKEITEATEINFKAPTYDSLLTNLTVTYCGIFYGSMAEYDEAAGITEEPVTIAPTPKETEAPDTEAPQTDALISPKPATDTEAKAPADEKSGCGSVMGGTALLISCTISTLSCIVVRRKKH